MTAFDQIGFEFLNRAALVSPALDTAIIFIADWLGYWVVAALIVWLLAATLPRWRREYFANVAAMSVFALASAVVARLGIAEIVRLWWDRPRPFEALAGVRQLLDHSRGDAFPSGHATFFFALAAGITPFYPRASIAFYLAAAAISLSRVIGGIHWPSDIIAGALVGIVTAIACRALLNKYRNATAAL